MLLFLSSLFLIFNLDCTSNKFNKVEVRVNAKVNRGTHTDIIVYTTLHTEENLLGVY